MQKILKHAAAFAITLVLTGLICIRAYAFNPYADDTSGFNKLDPVVYADPDSSTDDVSVYKNVYDQLPDIIKTTLSEYNIRIYIIPYPDTAEPANPTVSATAWFAVVNTEHHSNKVESIVRNGWITCYTDMPQGYCAPEQLIYAVGSELDNIASYMSGWHTLTAYGFSDEKIDEYTVWRDIYNTGNAKKLSKIWHYDELSELNWPLSAASGFADAFRLYICHPQDLQSISSQTYEYMENLVTRITDLNDRYSGSASLFVNSEAKITPEHISVEPDNNPIPIKQTPNSENTNLKPDSLKRFKINVRAAIIGVSAILSLAAVVILSIFITRINTKKKHKKDEFQKQYASLPYYSYKQVMQMHNDSLPGMYSITDNLHHITYTQYSASALIDCQAKLWEYSKKINAERMLDLLQIRLFFVKDSGLNELEFKKYLQYI